MTVYSIDPLNYARAQLLVLLDRREKTDAVFVHGSPAANDEIDTELLRTAVQMSRVGETGCVVINGLSDAECWPNGQRLAYPGSGTWGRVLYDLGCEDFLMIQPSKYTATESANLIKLAEENGWESLTIMSYPHHILRCMLQMVFCLERASSKLKVYTRTLATINWQMIATKGVLNGTPFSGTLIDVHMREEFDRVIRYADRDSATFTPHATLEELIEYFRTRDSL